MLCAGISFKFGVEHWMLYGGYAFLATFVVYNGQRLLKSNDISKTPWLFWVNSNKRFITFLIFITGLMLAAIMVSIVNFKYNVYLLLVIGGLSSLLYVVRIGKRNAREIPYLKIHLISITWVLVLVLFPIVIEDVKVQWLWISIAHYFYVLGVTIPFDIRDLKYDSPKHKTIPQTFGTIGAKRISVFALVLFYAMMILVYPDFLYNPFYHIGILVQIVLVLMMNEKRSDFYCAGLIDGAIAILGISYFF